MPEFPSYLTDALNQAYNPDLIKRLYDSMAGNLSAAQGSAVNNARSSAGSMAASRGLLNPSGFTTNAGSRVFGAYAPQFGLLEANRAGALQNQSQDYFKSIFGMWDANNKNEFARDQLDQNQAGFWDYFKAFAPLALAPVTGGGSLLGNFIMPPKKIG